MKLSYGLILIFLTPLLAGCEQLGLENPAVEQARVEAEGKAIGSGCRQTGRALEDCYDINRKVPKAAIFTGWRDMDAYMRENKIQEIRPDPPMTSPPGKSRPEAAEAIDKPAEAKPAQKDAAAATKPAAAIDKKTPDEKSAEPVPARKARPALAR